MDQKRLLIGISGASGSIYGIRLLEVLKDLSVEIHLIITAGAKDIITHETSYSLEQVQGLADVLYGDDDLFAGPASGSYQLEGMIITPCSMKTLAAIAHGYCNTLLSRSASCMLKESRPLILAIRETPLDLIALENMVTAKRAGAIVLPAMPGFYHQPQTIDDLIDFIVGKILDQLHLQHDHYTRWK